ncbi:hypothetical protein H0H81_000500 [Sphagnurus paluster]|uniref:DUF6535 domain-containing protein n=1 Tax=Sphagnurus paluster TaxID=117069 RepID=A0A9P7GKE6_9AGAR|nr:hypothetical protein H0H81_000500 [Sphagnurus paluster]
MSTTMGIDRSQETPALRTVNALFLSGLILSLMSASLAFLTARWLQRFSQKERNHFSEVFEKNRRVCQRIWHRLYPRRLRRALRRRARVSANPGQPLGADPDHPGPAIRQVVEVVGAPDALDVVHPVLNASGSWSAGATTIQGAETTGGSFKKVIVIPAPSIVDPSVNTYAEPSKPATIQDVEGKSFVVVDSPDVVSVKADPEPAELATRQCIDADQSPGTSAASGINAHDVAHPEGAKPTTSRGVEARKLPPTAIVIHDADLERVAPPIAHPSNTHAGPATVPTAASIRSEHSFQDNLAHVYFAYSLFIPFVLLILSISEMILGLLVFAWAEHALAVALVLTASCLLVMPFLLGVFLAGGASEDRDAIVQILSRKQGDW